MPTPVLPRHCVVPDLLLGTALSTAGCGPGPHTEPPAGLPEDQQERTPPLVWEVKHRSPEGLEGYCRG